MIGHAGDLELVEDVVGGQVCVLWKCLNLVSIIKKTGSLKLDQIVKNIIYCLEKLGDSFVPHDVKEPGLDAIAGATD